MTEEIWTQVEQYNYVTYQLRAELLYNIPLRHHKQSQKKTRDKKHTRSSSYLTNPGNSGHFDFGVEVILFSHLSEEEVNFVIFTSRIVLLILLDEGRTDKLWIWVQKQAEVKKTVVTV